MAADGLDELLLSALGVTGAQRLDGDVLGVANQLLQVVHGVHLVVFNADECVVELKGLHDEPDTADDLLAVLKHQAVVSGNVGLTFSTIDDNGVGFADCGTDLDVGGEARAAHTGTASVADDVDDLLRAQGIHIFPRLAVRAKGVLEVVLDHNGERRDASGTGTGFYCHNRARNTGVDGSAETRGSTDHLTDQNRVALLHRGLTGRTDVHRHRDHDLGRCFGERLDRFLLSSFLVFGGVDAAVQ